MSWFDTMKSPKIKNAKKREGSAPPAGAGLWKKCDSCGEVIQSVKLEETLKVCPYCDHHFRISSSERIDFLIDEDTFEPFGEHLASSDPLKFKDKKAYCDRLKETRTKTNMNDSVVAGIGNIDGRPVALAVMEFSFMGGSMGVVAGEKIAYTFDEAYKRKIPAIVISCSGGARMQEGILSLMQMAKTSGARQRLRQAGIPYISLLTDPTTGGCAASFAMLGDVNLAEPKALIGFAGPRVIEQTIRESLPSGFQTAEFLLEHGFIDRIVKRSDLKKEISFFIRMFSEAPATPKGPAGGRN